MRLTLPNAHSVSTCKVYFAAHFSCSPLACGERDVYWGCSELGAPLRPSRAAARTVREIVTAAEPSFIPFQEIFAVGGQFAAGTRAEKERQHAAWLPRPRHSLPGNPLLLLGCSRRRLWSSFSSPPGSGCRLAVFSPQTFFPIGTASSVTSACFGPRSSRI